MRPQAEFIHAKLGAEQNATVVLFIAHKHT